MSPTKGSDETSNFKAILESVCHTDQIGKEAIAQLCKHVKADPQEETVSTHRLQIPCMRTACFTYHLYYINVFVGVTNSSKPPG